MAEGAARRSDCVAKTPYGTDGFLVPAPNSAAMWSDFVTLRVPRLKQSSLTTTGRERHSLHRHPRHRRYRVHYSLFVSAAWSLPRNHRDADTLNGRFEWVQLATAWQRFPASTSAGTGARRQC